MLVGEQWSLAAVKCRQALTSIGLRGSAQHWSLIFPHLDLLSDCGLLAHHAHQLVDHLLAVYPHGRDLPLDLLSLADRLLLEVGGDLTFHLLLRLANNGVLGRGILDQRWVGGFQLLLQLPNFPLQVLQSADSSEDTRKEQIGKIENSVRYNVIL